MVLKNYQMGGGDGGDEGKIGKHLFVFFGGGSTPIFVVSINY
jgi:hypothetical protein